MDALYTSFRCLFETEKTHVENIVIPRIQRAYAQGRNSNMAKRTRKNFLDAIYEALAKEETMTLDFIYGNIKPNKKTKDEDDPDGALVPLDGQQRLTTLFLLHWYAAKKENFEKSEYLFLKNFTYETRPSARDFCEKLVDFNPAFEEALSTEIKNENWFPMDWKHDATVVAMLNMLDSIQERFAEVEDLWKRLDNIKFYFLSLKELNATDDIYIKMNSRGKPLTDFEHWKAEFEKKLKAIDESIAERIMRKIDINWTDLLWTYRHSGGEDDNVIDDEFIRYFRFICDILCYKSNSSPKDEDVFQLTDKYFTGEHAKENVQLFESYFDCWIDYDEDGKPHNKDIKAFFETFISGRHEPGKIVSKYNTNLMESCFSEYGVTVNGRNRRFTLNQVILLYAFITYLQHNDNVTESQFIRRIRILNNIVINSPFEISDSESRRGGNRMPAILKQVDSIIVDGVISDDIVVNEEPQKENFNKSQMEEERLKLQFTDDNPGMSEDLFVLEDHPLLSGHISVVGLDHPEYFSRFAQLFECDRDLVDCALLSVGNYTQRDNNWRIQMGSKGMDMSWINLFHNSNLGNTRECMSKLLSSDEKITDDTLRPFIDAYLIQCEQQKLYDWRYYYIKYHSFRIGRYGKYWQPEEKPYEITSIFAAQYYSSKSHQVFLNELNLEYNIGDLDREQYGTRITFDDSYLECKNDAFVVFDKEGNELWRLIIPQKDGIDTVNRIAYAGPRIKEYLQSEN